MNEDMSEIINKLGSIMNNSSNNSNNTDNAENDLSSGSPSISPEMISGMLEMLKSKNAEGDGDTSSNSNNSNSSTSIPNIDFETILKFKSAFDKINSKDDPRSKLLLALKPYLKESRQEKVEQYIQLFNVSKIIDVFGHNSGGDGHK